MSFLIDSLFRADGIALTDKLKNVAHVSVVRPLQEKIAAQFATPGVAGRFISDLSELWADVQQGSSAGQQTDALNRFLLKNLPSETSEWLQSFFENIPSLDYVIGDYNEEDQNGEEGINGFEDLSDIVKDLIKSMKFLIVFEAVNDIQEELHVPHFNTRTTVQERPRNPVRRYIGRV